MNGKRRCDTHTHTHTHTHRNITQPLKERNLAICNNMDGRRRYYAKWNKSEGERQKEYDFTYMWNLKTKTNEQIEQKQSHRHGEQTGGCQGEGDEGIREIC